MTKVLAFPQIPEDQEMVIAWEDGPGTVFIAKDKKGTQVYLYIIEPNAGHAELVSQFEQIEIQKSN